MIKELWAWNQLPIVIGDEAVLLDQERLFNNVQTTNRSTCGGLYEDQPLCNAEIYASSVAMTQKGQWFTDLEALAKKEPWKVVCESSCCSK
jgi:hypothetical protein